MPVVKAFIKKSKVVPFDKKAEIRRILAFLLVLGI